MFVELPFILIFEGKINLLGDLLFPYIFTDPLYFYVTQDFLKGVLSVHSAVDAGEILVFL